MKQALKHVGMFFFMQFICCALFAQRFENVSFDGAQTVCSIAQDGQGMMWLGTENGLYSYDGYHSYRHYTPQDISNTRINALLAEGNLLYLATGNGLLQFDMHSNRYVRGAAQDASRKEVKRKSVRELRAVHPLDKRSLYGSDVYALLQIQQGLLKGTLTGLYLVKKGAANAKSTMPKGQLLPLCAGTQPLVNALAYDRKRKCYWIGTEGALYCADLQLKNFSQITSLQGNSIKCLATADNGTLYIGTDNGLYVMAQNGTVSHYTHDSRNASSIPNNIVWSCMVDKWQNVWIGTDNGLSRLVTCNYYQFTSLDKITISGEGNCLHAILQTKNGDWWMGGTNGLIHFRQVDTTNGEGVDYQNVAWYKQNNTAYPLTHNRVRKIYEDHDGDVWTCTDHGINLYNPANRQLINFIVYDKTGKYSTAWAYDILQDENGKIWMASYMGGIFVIDKSRLIAELTRQAYASPTVTIPVKADFHYSDSGKYALSGLHVGQMVMDGKGMIWASTYNRLDRIDPNSGMKLVHMTEKGVINFLMTDAEGNVWVGNNHEVKCYLVKDAARGAVPPVKTWHVGGKVSTMCDVKGSMWVVSGKECSVISKNGKSFRFAIPAITPLAMYYAANSHRVVMGGNDGFVSVDEDVAEPRVRPMSLTLAGIMVNGRQMQGLDGEQEMGKMPALAPSYYKELTLESDENSFTLQLTDLPFANHPSDVYAYKLEGSDHEWQYLKEGNIDIAYNGLPHGDYHLTVHVVNGEGKVADEVYSLDISILPPWYLSWWAKTLYALLVVCLVLWMMKFYLVRKHLVEERRQKAEILQQVEARMNFFARLSDQLKGAVARRSFEEVYEVVCRSLDIKTASGTLATTDNNGVSQTEGASDNTEMDEADRKLLDEITQAIEEYMIDSDFNVTMLQKVMGIGDKQLYRKLKSLTGRTPVEYIREMRMRKAANLLSEGKFSVSEVMYTVGFSNSSYFSKCFSKEFGMNPTEYMKKV